MKMTVSELAERLARQYSRTNPHHPFKFDESSHQASAVRAPHFFKIFDGLGFDVYDMSILSPRPYQYHYTFLVRRKPKIAHLEFDIDKTESLMLSAMIGADLLIQEGYIVPSANYFIISLFGEE